MSWLSTRHLSYVSTLRHAQCSYVDRQGGRSGVSHIGGSLWAAFAFCVPLGTLGGDIVSPWEAWGPSAGVGGQFGLPWGVMLLKRDACAQNTASWKLIRGIGGIRGIPGSGVKKCCSDLSFHERLLVESKHPANKHILNPEGLNLRLVSLMVPKMLDTSSKSEMS